MPGFRCVGSAALIRCSAVNEILTTVGLPALPVGIGGDVTLETAVECVRCWLVRVSLRQYEHFGKKQSNRQEDRRKREVSIAERGCCGG